MNIGRYILVILSIMIMKKLYDKVDGDSNMVNDYNLVNKFLISGNDLAQDNKPILWIHLNYEVNARDWKSFYSRNTRQLNQPYHYITIKSTVDKCGNDFNICLIDDDSFSVLLPRWNVELHKVSEPVKSKLRELALAQLLYNYGGCLIPGSMKCYTNMIQMYNENTNDNKMFVGEFLNTAEHSDKQLVSLNTRLMGCNSQCSSMKDYIDYLSNLISTDYSNESIFNGETSEWLFENLNNINVIPSELLGAIDRNRDPITIDRLMGKTYIDLSPNIIGLYIPEKDILQRVKYEWFARSNVDQVLSGNYALSKLLLIQ